MVSRSFTEAPGCCSSSDLFVRGRARAPYNRTWDDMMSTKSDSESDSAGSGRQALQPAAKKKKSCACRVPLGVHEESFKAMKVTGAVLKKRQGYKAKGDAASVHRHIMPGCCPKFLTQVEITCTVLLALSLFLVFGRNVWPDYARWRGVIELPAEYQLSGKPSHHSRPDLKARFF